MLTSSTIYREVIFRCDQFVLDYQTLNKDDKIAVENFISSHRTLINSLIVLSTVYMPSEDNYDDYALLRDHVLIPLFGKEDIPHVHFHVSIPLFIELRLLIFFVN